MTAMQGTAGSSTELKAFITLAFRGFHVSEEQDKLKTTLNKQQTRLAAAMHSSGWPRELARDYLRVLLLEQIVCEWDLPQNETFGKSATSDLVRMVLHPLIDLEQLNVVLLVCTRMQKKKIPALSACLCGGPD